jgi:hypothetical protein
MKCKKTWRQSAINSNVDRVLPTDYPWKVLQELTNDLAAYLEEDDISLISQIIRDRDHDAYLLLQDIWGLQNCSIGLEISSTLPKIRARLAIAALLKKFQFRTDKSMRETNALRKFREAEVACMSYNQSGYMDLSWGETEFDAEVFTYAREFVGKVLGRACPTKALLTLGSRHGPGNNLDTYKGASSIYFKYENWPYSCTQAVVPYARYLIATDARWIGALENSYRDRYNIPATEILNRQVFWENVLKVVEGNRITFAPKDARTERTIAIEPCINLMLQLGVDEHIRKRLKRWDVDLDDQGKNQFMAYLGSQVDSDESYVTLDLSAASDSLSLKLCKLLLPSEWYDYLLKLRSPKGSLEGEIIFYEKISSMGNGYTFALESLLFTAITSAVIKATKGHCDFVNDLSIFGDDIICRREYVFDVVKALSRAGLRLNLDKSFLKGYTKESCGTDWIHGKPVRPVFLQKQPVDVGDLFTDLNRLQRMLDIYWSIDESDVVTRIKKWIPDAFKGIVGPYSDDEYDSYIHTKVPPGPYVRSMWKFSRLIRKAVEHRGRTDFFFRKLMHDLRPARQVPSYIGQQRIKTGGSRFTVYKSHSYTVSKTYSLVSKWPDNYAWQPPTRRVRGHLV